MPADSVTAAPDRDEELRIACMAHRGDDVGRAGALRNQARPPVDGSVPDAPRGIELRVLAGEDASAETGNLRHLGPPVAGSGRGTSANLLSISQAGKALVSARGDLHGFADVGGAVGGGDLTAGQRLEQADLLEAGQRALQLGLR